MNFSLSALTLALFTTTVSAKASTRIKLSRNLRKDSAVTRALLNKARPYKKTASTTPVRRLEENELDGSYNLKFSQCVDIKTYDEDNDANYADAIAAGTVTPTKSYVIFHVCTDQTCGYEGEDDLYIVDLATYLGTVATYHAEKKGNYCGACEEFEEVCNAEEEEEVADEEEEGDEENEEEGKEEEAAEDEEEEEDRDNEEEDEEEDREEENEEDERDEEGEEEEGEEENQDRRKLKTRKLGKVAIDCDQCQAYDCYAEDDEDAQDLDEQAAEWIKAVSECQQAEIQVNGADVFYGAMCDEYGDGVELAVFLDEKCSLYTSEIAFNNIYMKEEGNDAYNYLTYAENYIKSAFSDVMSCDDTEYYNPEEEQDENEEEKYEMNEYCKDILKDDAVFYSECEADEDAEQLYTEDGYAYDIAYDEDLNIEEVCAVVKKMENAGEYFNAYDSSSSGTWYKRDKNGQIIVESSEGKTSGGLSGGAIFGIIAAIAVVVSGLAFTMMKKSSKKGDIAESAEYQGGALS